MQTVNKVEIPVLYQGVFRKAAKSKANAIKANCISCCGFMSSVAADCGVDMCPLLPHNPYRKSRLKREAKNENTQENN